MIRLLNRVEAAHEKRTKDINFLVTVYIRLNTQTLNTNPCTELPSRSKQSCVSTKLASSWGRLQQEIGYKGKMLQGKIAM
jgi:hypothetical protein